MSPGGKPPPIAGVHDDAMSASHDDSHDLGTELRRARLAARKGQRSMAALVGCSQSTISRMELGRGGQVPLATWLSAARVVDRGFMLQPTETAEGEVQSVVRRCHRAVGVAAQAGGWSVVTEVLRSDGSEDIETLLVRPTETAVVHVWDVVAGIAGRIRLLAASIERERSYPDRSTVSGLVVVRAGFGNRRRMTEGRSDLEAAFPTLAAHWFAALRSPHRSMPDQPGVLWANRDGTRLLPAPLVPGWIWITPAHRSRLLKSP